MNEILPVLILQPISYVLPARNGCLLSAAGSLNREIGILKPYPHSNAVASNCLQRLHQNAHVEPDFTIRERPWEVRRNNHCALRWLLQSRDERLLELGLKLKQDLDLRKEDPMLERVKILKLGG